MHEILAFGVPSCNVFFIRRSPVKISSRNPQCSRKPLWRRGAFSLIELLSVMAIASLLAAVVVPAMNGLKAGGGLTRAAADMSSVLEQARAYAMAHNTYVFVGLTEVDASVPNGGAQQAGTGRVVVAVAGSRDGTRTFDSTNLVALSKVRRFDNVHLADAVPNEDRSARPAVAAEYQLGNAAFCGTDSLSWPFSGGVPATGFTRVIRFDPRGAVSTLPESRSLPQWIEIGLVPARGNTVTVGANYAALLVDGVTGSVRIFRP